MYAHIHTHMHTCTYPFTCIHTCWHQQLTTLKNESLFWHHVPDRMVCFLDAPPHPPSPPSSATITTTNYTLEGDNLHVEIAWAPPNKTYGAIIMYQVQVGTKLLQGSQGTSVQNYASENVQVGVADLIGPEVWVPHLSLFQLSPSSPSPCSHLSPSPAFLLLSFHSTSSAPTG